MFSLFGVLDSFDGGRTQPIWAFEPRNMEGRTFLATCQMMGQVEVAKRRRNGENPTAQAIAVAVITNPAFAKVRDALMVFASAPREQQAALLGIDPATISREQMHEAALAMFSQK
jgi:hypothetical protein